ncbi:MAG TPA: serine/threonine-protein kinase, partial [Casimicrobium sp.]|nr:serine/threonine-protein kinase [Casimicrobium sp.]
GQPFLAMEYVAGEPIDAYCDKHRLTIKARLTLYLQVLDAVEFAHRQLVLHRDLKPGNVLVDGHGHARLLDFGVAKLLPGTGATTNTDLSTAKGTDLTEMAGAAITLAYAAPEQINNGRLSTATDVYALGVMLYRLLSGSAPYQPKRDTRGALEDEVLTTDPGNASTRFASSETLAARQTTEVALRRALAGDIDTILAKALKKNPDDRYPTVEAFAKDIERALNGQPVLAQPDSAWYRTRKFVQRHPWAVAVSSAGAVTLMVAAGVAVWQGGEARTQAALAEREASRAKAVQQFLVTLFQSANPEKSRGKTLTVREVLDQGAQRMRTEFANQPETEAALAGEIGVIYESLGDLDKAVTFLGRKVALLDSVRKSGTADFVGANERLGRYLVAADRFVEAEAPLARALAEAA